MNRTLLTLAGLLLAAPLAAQQPSTNELKASELLQQSAQKAMAGYEAEATKLAVKAMALLAADNAKAEGKVRFVLEEKQDDQHEGGVIIVDGPDGREVIEFINSDDITMESMDALGAIDEELAMAWSHQAPETLEQLAELGYIVELEGNAELGEGFEWHSDSDHDVIWMTDGDVHHNAPMDHGDLHHQLREIQHELESLRHELHALRSEMSGNRRGGMQGNRRTMRFPGGEWNMNNNQFQDGARFQLRTAPGQMQRLELHGMEGMPERLHLNSQNLRGMELHEMHLNEGEDFDFDFDFPEGAEVHEEVVVIINGEKFTGEAARVKLKELNVDLKGEVEGKVRMRMRGNGGAFPMPPEPPKPPQQNHWRSKEHGHDHEDL